MISYLNGKVAFLNSSSICLEVNGVGYEVSIPSSVLEHVSKGKNLELFIHTHVREDQISLFGFLDFETLELFKKMLSISGIGPKSALEIASFAHEKVYEAISQEDTLFLSQVPGIGKKTAGRIILELKNKLPDFDISASKNNFDQDAVDALMNLGFDKKMIIKILKEHCKDAESTEDKIKIFLQKI